MEIAFGVDRIQPSWTRSVVCIGTFDGVHLGHQAVIEQAVRQAQVSEVPCVLVTFDRHPAAILAPERCPKAVQGLGANLKEFERLGVSTAVVLAFDEELAATSAENFFHHILLERLKATAAVVGHDFAFGHDRVGTPFWLSGRIETTVVPPFLMHGERVSSSGVRQAIERGDVQQANQWLGRNFALEGTVVSGQKLGRELGFPTLNLAQTSPTILPFDGVYAGRWGSYQAAISIGMRPAVKGTNRTIEAFLLDFAGPGLYGQSGRLEFTARLRDELPFPDLDALVVQMKRDVQTVRGL